MHCGTPPSSTPTVLLLLHTVCMHTCADAVPSLNTSQHLQPSRRPAWEANAEAVIVCADPESPNPTECTFTAPVDGSYSFIWAEQPTAGGFDLIKLGLEPVDAVHIGDRFGRFFTDCCDGGPCEFLDTNLVRYTGGACTGAPSAPIPGDPQPPPPPPPPDNPPCEPDPGVPPTTCCALEPTGACQRPCCCDSGGSDFVEAYCRGAALNSTSAARAAAKQLASSSHNGMMYSGLVVGMELEEGFTVTLLTQSGGLL